MLYVNSSRQSTQSFVAVDCQRVISLQSVYCLDKRLTTSIYHYCKFYLQACILQGFLFLVSGESSVCSCRNRGTSPNCCTTWWKTSQLLHQRVSLHRSTGFAFPFEPSFWGVGKAANPWFDKFLNYGKLKPYSSIGKGMGITADIKQIREHDYP